MVFCGPWACCCMLGGPWGGGAGGGRLPPYHNWTGSGPAHGVSMSWTGIVWVSRSLVWLGQARLLTIHVSGSAASSGPCPSGDDVESMAAPLERLDGATSIVCQCIARTPNSMSHYELLGPRDTSR